MEFPILHLQVSSRTTLLFGGHRERRTFQYDSSFNHVKVLASSSSDEKRGFGTKSTRKKKNAPEGQTQQITEGSRGRNASAGKSGSSAEAPELASKNGRDGYVAKDREFNERLEAVRRSALEQKMATDSEAYQAIDYDTPVSQAQEKGSFGLGTKVGVGVAVVALGLVFALGDFLPSGRPTNSVQDGAIVDKKNLSEEEKNALKERLRQYESTLASSPNNVDALEGTAVTLVDLGDYGRAAPLLEKLAKEKEKDSEAYRLLGEVKYELKDYAGSAAAYRKSLTVSGQVDFDVVRGLVNALLSSKKPDEAVQVLLETRGQLKSMDEDTSNSLPRSGDTRLQKVDPIQIELLLGKAYSDWSHLSDAVSVYDQLISNYPNDFRGYLAKAIILKENGKDGDAERMFIQAKYFAPDKAKALVDRYASR